MLQGGAPATTDGEFQTQSPVKDVSAFAGARSNGSFVGEDTFSGSTAALSYKSMGGGITRAGRARLLSAGILHGLPVASQNLLLGGPGAAFLNAPTQMELEDADPRTISDVIIQFLCYTPHNAVNTPKRLDKAFFSFRFFDFKPTQTTMAVLEKMDQALLSVRPFSWALSI